MKFESQERGAQFHEDGAVRAENRAEEVAKATNEIEASLERNDAPQNILAKWLRGALAAGLLVGGMGASADAGGQEGLPEKADTVAEAVIQHSQHTEAERQALLEKTGYDIEAIASNAGFEARLDVDNGTGPYIVHIGQTHYSESIERWSPSEQKKEEDEIITSQKKIEQALLAFSSQSGGDLTNVFQEGILVDSGEQLTYEKYRETLSRIKAGKGCFIQVLASYQNTPYFHNSDASCPKIILTYLHRQKLDQLEQYYVAHPEENDLSGKKTEPKKADVSTKADASKKELTPQEEFDKDTKETAEQADKILKKLADDMREVMLGIPKHPEFTNMSQELAFARTQMTNKFDSFGQDGIYFAGAVHKLSAEGKVRMIGCETADANTAGLIAHNNQIKAVEKYSKIKTEDLVKLSPEEQKRIIEELKNVLVVGQQKMFDEREDLALSIIGKEGGALNQRILPLVFGAKHQFKRAVLEYDQKNPDRKIGLIELVPVK